jgi:two-component system LytT family response regulator
VTVAQEAAIRAVIVDDEPLARRGIRLRLDEEPGFEVVAEYPSGTAASREIGRVDPDVVFLDVEMPGMNGFEMLERIGSTRAAVVFLTAHEEYALSAFAVKALDYLLKPPSEERMERAIRRIREHVEGDRAATLGRRVRAIVDDGTAWSGGLLPRATHDVLRVKHRNRVLLLRSDRVDWIEAAGNYVELHIGTESHLLRETMNKLESRLDPKLFLRIHRRLIVNVERIRQLEGVSHGEYVVVLKDGTRLGSSRGYRDGVQRLLETGV